MMQSRKVVEELSDDWVEEEEKEHSYTAWVQDVEEREDRKLNTLNETEDEQKMQW